MPVILSKEEEKIWLSDDLKPDELIHELCDHYPDELMAKYRVSKDVNKVANNHRELIVETNYEICRLQRPENIHERSEASVQGRYAWILPNCGWKNWKPNGGRNTKRCHYIGYGSK